VRWVYLLALILLIILDILPIPILGILLVWVVIFRPAWFYEAVLKIYDK